MFSSDKSLNKSRASGLDNASIFLIFLPWITSLTASSVILPDLVLGISATEIILAGTCLGLTNCLSLFLISVFNFSSKEIFSVS